MPNRKHIPIRTCVSCRAKAAKRDLLRVVASSDGRVALDGTGRLNGRGAYLCAACRSAPESLRRGRLEHSLRTSMEDADWGTLLRSIGDAQNAAAI